MAYKNFDDLSGNSSTENSFSGNTNIITIQSNGQESIDLPDQSYVTDADISRDGMNLILETPEGTVIIEEYYAAETSPNLTAPNGATLTPNLVNSFTQSDNQYADASLSMNDVSPVGAVQEISGEATITRLDGSVEIISIGTPVYQGDVVDTQEDGAVNIMFIDETTFAVSEDARLSIDEYVFDPQTASGTSNFSVLKGIFIFTSGLIGRDDPDDVMIDTPSGSIGIRGTIIAGNVNTGEITVIEGAIVLHSISGATLTMASQYETARFNNEDQTIDRIGQLGAQEVADKFDSVSSVSPELFSSIADSAEESNNAPEEQQEPEQQQQDTPEMAEEPVPEEEGASLELEPAPTQEPIQEIQIQLSGSENDIEMLKNIVHDPDATEKQRLAAHRELQEIKAEMDAQETSTREGEATKTTTNDTTETAPGVLDQGPAPIPEFWGVLTATQGGAIYNGGAGPDVFNNFDGSILHKDLAFKGKGGNDTIRITVDNSNMGFIGFDGGAGTNDVLKIIGAGGSTGSGFLDFSKVNHLKNIEKIDLAQGGTTNSATISLTADMIINNNSSDYGVSYSAGLGKVLTIDGNSQDYVNISLSGWVDNTATAIGTHGVTPSYSSYTNGTHTVLIDNNINDTISLI